MGFRLPPSMSNTKARDLPLEGAVGHHTSPSEPPEYLQSGQEGEVWEEEPLMSLDGEVGGQEWGTFHRCGLLFSNQEDVEHYTAKYSICSSVLFQRTVYFLEDYINSFCKFCADLSFFYQKKKIILTCFHTILAGKKVTEEEEGPLQLRCLHCANIPLWHTVIRSETEPKLTLWNYIILVVRSHWSVVWRGRATQAGTAVIIRNIFLPEVHWELENKEMNHKHTVRKACVAE